jgi:tetratricopeptide (TPR) repeat protein
MSRESIEKYTELLRKDPNSKAFAALADALREIGETAKAEKIAQSGIKRHPQYYGGYLVLGKIQLNANNFSEAESCFIKATTLSPENLLAHQLLGQTYLQTKRPKDALKSYKLVLFLNPQSEIAKKAVAKLEGLTADEFEQDIFEMKKMSPSPEVEKADIGNTLERNLAYIDALIVRNNIERAKVMIRDLSKEYPDNPEIAERWELISGESEELEEAVPIYPDLTREKFIITRKIQRLDFVLQRIKAQQFRGQQPI